MTTAECWFCDGTGTVHTIECPLCDGDGTIGK